MRSLAQPKVLMKAGIAALLSSLACWPRLALWVQKPEATWFLWLILLWAAFVLWGFVFAWQKEYAHRPAFISEIPMSAQVLATCLGLAGAAFLHFFMDGPLRERTPQDYPQNGATWAAVVLFDLSFVQLFLCFAPFAFFIRLFKKEKVAVILTVCFGVFVLFLKATSATTPPTPLLFAGLLFYRVLAGWIAVYLYLKGGVFLVWWWWFLILTRHLIGLLS